MHIPDAEEYGAFDMNVADERENLINEICQYLMPLVADVSDAKAALHIITNKYEILSRSTELTVANGDRNEDLLGRFIISKTVKGCTERTIKAYQTSIKHILQAIGKTATEITADDIRLYMAIRKRRDGVTDVTIGNEIRNLSSFFQWMTAEEYILKNPMNRIDRIKVRKTRKKALTDMEVEKLRAAAAGERENTIIEMLLSTGCRVSEIAQIALDEITDDRILVHGKGKKDRYVYLNARAMLAMQMYLRRRKDKNPYLFPRCKSVMEMSKKGRDHRTMKDWWTDPRNVENGHISQSAIEQITRKIAKRAGVQQANPHKFRRTCATMALRRGMPIEQVSKMLGHEEISTTQIYLDLAEDELAQAHKKYVI